jgi:hypothetical protein
MKKMFACILFFCACLTASAQYVTNGTATQMGGTEYRLTQATYNQGGSVWYQQRLDLRYDFTINTEIYLGSIDAGGADGIAFVLQPLNVNQGVSGGGIEYFGIVPSMAIEFDTWQNYEFNDPAEDHVGFMRNGSTVHTKQPSLFPNMEDGAWHTAVFEWNAAQQTLSVVAFNKAYILQDNLVMSVFNGSPYVYWGFTGATGAAINDQRVRIGATSFVEEINIPGTVTNASCPGSYDGAIDISPTGGNGPYTFVWSNLETTEDIANLAAGTYTVTVTDASDVSKSQTFTVGSGNDNTAPVVVCPSASTTLCNSSSGTYTIPTLNATDNCSIAGITYTISGATNRTGTGNDASGLLENGTNYITWTVTDAAGNTTACTQQIIVNPPVTGSMPDVYAVNPGGNANTIYIGYGPSSLTLTANPSGGTRPYTYSWSTGETTQSITVSPTSTQTYTLTVTDAAGCTVVLTKTIQVVDVRCGKNMDKVIVCHVPPGNSGNAHEICISPNAVPAHIIEHGDMLGACAGSSAAAARKPLDEANEYKELTAIQPNPSRGQFQLRLDATKGAQVRILDTRGRLVQHRQVSAGARSNQSFDISREAAGIYLVQVTTNGTVQTFKIVLQK